MTLLLTFVIALLGAAAVVLIVVRARAQARTPDITIESSAGVEAIVRGVRIRMTAALAVYLLAILVVAIDLFGLQPASWLGLGQALGVAIAAILACLVIVVSPFSASPASDGVRTAELTPRGGASFGPRWGFTLPIASAGILVAFLVGSGLVSSRDDFGLYRAFTVAYGNRSSTSSPYPGWFYGLPIIGVTIVLAVVVLLALRRIASAPRPSSRGLFDVDDAARRTLTRFVMLLSSSALLLYFGAVAALAGLMSSNASGNLTSQPDWSISPDGIGPNVDALPFVLQSGFVVGRVELVLGLGLALFGIVLVFSAAVTAAVRWAPVREAVSA